MPVVRHLLLHPTVRNLGHRRPCETGLDFAELPKMTESFSRHLLLQKGYSKRPLRLLSEGPGTPIVSSIHWKLSRCSLEACARLRHEVALTSHRGYPVYDSGRIDRQYPLPKNPAKSKEPQRPAAGSFAKSSLEPASPMVLHRNWQRGKWRAGAKEDLPAYSA